MHLIVSVGDSTRGRATNHSRVQGQPAKEFWLLLKISQKLYTNQFYLKIVMVFVLETLEYS
jgi:hypothetical protein